MSTIVKIAESLADLYDLDIQRLDIQYNYNYKSMAGYLHLGDPEDLDPVRTFEVLPSGRFSEIKR